MGKVRFIWSLLFFSGDVYASVRWLQPAGLTMNLELGAPEYAALITLFTGGIVGINWAWIHNWRLREVRRFRSLAPDLYRLARLTTNPHHDHEVRAIGFHLNELGISSPDSDIETWESFLETIANHAAHGLLKKARQLGDEHIA